MSQRELESLSLAMAIVCLFVSAVGFGEYLLIPEVRRPDGHMLRGLVFLAVCSIFAICVTLYGRRRRQNRP